MGISRPSMQSVQRSLVIGVLAGAVVGCLLGLVFGTYYAWQVNPAVYSGGAYPRELTAGYQTQYIASVVDSYIVNRNVDAARERLKTFSPAQQIEALGQRSADFVANGQAVESQLVNELALNLKSTSGWDDQVVEDAIARLSVASQADSARTEAVNAFSVNLLNAVPRPVDSGAAPAPAGDGTAPAPADTTAAPAQGSSWRWILGCLLLLILLVAAILLAGRWQLARNKAKARPQVAWEGEGPAPLKVWSGTYTLGQDNYDEFFTIETFDGDFLGESGMGIMKAIAGTDPKQVTAFDVGLFDKTDITTLSRVVMSEYAYNNDSELMANINSNAKAEAILAEPGKEFTLETAALRVMAKIEEMEYGEGNVYFNRLKVSLNVFVREGADLKIGKMDIPEAYQGQL
ncbi:MAG: hypothetical protein KDF65_12825 [Anaerolineae bacterium]|nr:hypothetical protein [Anaerolineae bacterium]